MFMTFTDVKRHATLHRIFRAVKPTTRSGPTGEYVQTLVRGETIRHQALGYRASDDSGSGSTRRENANSRHANSTVDPTAGREAESASNSAFAD
jgi:hypothetical protein